MLNKCSRIFSLICVFVIFMCNFSFANPISDITGGVAQITTEDVGNIIGDGGKEITNLTLKIVSVISDISLPICSLLCLWGAVLYFILGIRNLYKKRQGMLLMWGSFTFLVIAKIANFVVWFLAR